MGIEVVGRLGIKGHDQIRRVYGVGGGITYFIHNGWWQPRAKDTRTVYRCKPWEKSDEP